MKTFKEIIVIIQAYLLFFNTAFAETARVNKSQQVVNSTFHYINTNTLKILHTKLSEAIQNPNEFIKNLKDEKIKDYSAIEKKIIEYSDKIKTVKTNLKNDQFEIILGKTTLEITEIDVFNNIMIVNGKKVSWNPSTDSFESLKKKLSEFVTTSGKTSMLNFFINDAHAGEGITFVLAVVAALFAVLFFLFSDLIPTTLEFKNMYHKAQGQLQEAEDAIKLAIQQCDDDLTNLKAGVQSQENETIKFMEFIVQHNSRKTERYEKKLNLLSCDNFKDKKSFTYRTFTFLIPFWQTAGKMCELGEHLESCLGETKEEAAKKKVAIKSEEKRFKIRYNKPSYVPFLEKFTGGAKILTK